MSDFADAWVHRSTAAAIEMGMLNPWLYINYAKENQDPFSGYGEGNRQRLQRIQREIDPLGIFTSTGLCRGSFKVL